MKFGSRQGSVWFVGGWNEDRLEGGECVGVVIETCKRLYIL